MFLFFITNLFFVFLITKYKTNIKKYKNVSTSALTRSKLG